MSQHDDKPPAPEEGYLTLAQLPMPLDTVQLFGRQAETELEIGAGRGDFMIQYATAHPEINFIAVERKLVILRRAGIKLLRSGLTNSRIFNGDIVYLLRNYIQPESLQAIHIYFTDPWPKKKHAHRRVFTPENLDLFLRSIKPGGYLHTRTDVEGYFHTMLEIANTRPDLITIEPPANVTDHMTNFEMRFVAEGKPIYRASWKKTAN